MSLATLTTRTSSFRHGEQRARLGMTLVELLVAITIIATLAAIVYGTLSGAGETAREARTKQLITRLHTLLNDRYESYRDRRIDAAYDGTGQVLAAQRLHVLRTTMQMELPDRWSDILNDTVDNVTPENVYDGVFNPDASAPLELSRVDGNIATIERTALNRLFIRRYGQLYDSVNNESPSTEDLLRNQSAECLYLIIMNATGDGEARSMFKETDVADTDGDGAMEFIDGWGNPIHFVRWPRGYAEYSSLMFYPRPDSNLTFETINNRINDHDPFDIFRIDTDATRSADGDVGDPIRLVPLIYSAGPDEEYGIATNFSVASGNDPNFQFGTVPLSVLGGTQLVRDPYQPIDQLNSEDFWAGTPVETNEFGQPTAEDLSKAEQHVDNIVNHNITAR